MPKFLILGTLLFSIYNTGNAIKCADGYTCFEQTTEGVVWVMKNNGNVNGPNCANVCPTALCGSGSFFACDSGRTAFQDMESFAEVAAGLSFSCKRGGCWGSEAPGVGMTMVSKDMTETNERSCYFPTETTFNCNNNPGNANCFGERYSLICPCVAKALDQACQWDSPPNRPAMATWPKNNEGRSCIERINYWRKRACDEGWPECPPCGLPPMTECIDCHQCANSQAEYDSENGAHKSFKRCGDMVQGEGGGNDCAAVIDAFVSERQVFDDSDGKVVCRGHCGPIVAHGCQTFFWGRARDSGFHTLNWRTCNAEKCSNYCQENSAECFTVETSPHLWINSINSETSSNFSKQIFPSGGDDANDEKTSPSTPLDDSSSVFNSFVSWEISVFITIMSTVMMEY